MNVRKSRDAEGGGLIVTFLRETKKELFLSQVIEIVQKEFSGVSFSDLEAGVDENYEFYIRRAFLTRMNWEGSWPVCPLVALCHLIGRGRLLPGAKADLSNVLVFSVAGDLFLDINPALIS